MDATMKHHVHFGIFQYWNFTQILDRFDDNGDVFSSDQQLDIIESSSMNHREAFHLDF